MADVADGWLRANAWTSASLHRAGERARPRLWTEPLHGRDAAALRSSGPPACKPRVRCGPSVRCRFCDPRLGLAASAPQGGAVGFSSRRTLVQRTDGATWREARNGSEAGLSLPRRRSLKCGVPVRRGFGDRIEMPGVTGSSAFADDDRRMGLLDRP